MTEYTEKPRKCTVQGCNNKHVAKGYCKTHYYRFRRYGDPLVVKETQAKNGDGSCKVDGCQSKHSGRGYCKYHYYRWEKYGDPLYERPTVCKISGCNKPINARGLCQMHYRRLKVHGDTDTVLINRGTPCVIEGCKKTNRRNGYCEEHYRESKLYRNRHRQYSAQRRAVQASVPINDFTEDDWSKILESFDKKCSYCGRRTKLEQEHIVPITKGGSHTMTNIIPACKSCNSSKRQRLLDNWYPLQPFYEKEREDKILKWMGYNPNKKEIQLNLF